MRKKLLLIATAITALTSFTSCLKDDDEITYYDDVAITAFSLGTLNTYTTVKTTAGADSLKKSSQSFSSYVFNIDQKKALVWNNDSLPLGTDTKKALVSVSTRNSAIATLKDIDSDSYTVISSSDSLDFSQPRTVRVYSNSGNSYRDYTVTINVHKENGDSCQWTEIVSGDADLMKLTNVNAVARTYERIDIFGNDGDTPKWYIFKKNNGNGNFEKSDFSQNIASLFSAESAKNVITPNNFSMYTIANGKLLYALDGVWSESFPAAEVKQLLGMTKGAIYALSTEGKIIASKDKGATWEEESLDDDASLLPTRDIAFASHVMATDETANKLVLVGNRDNDTDKTAVAWQKVEESDDSGRENRWVRVRIDGTNRYPAPRLENWQVVNYDANKLKAIGGSTTGEEGKAVQQLLNSSDDGITWQTDTTMTLPETLITDTDNFAMTTDNEGSVIIVNGKTGQLWKGRINRLAWKKETESFFE